MNSPRFSSLLFCLLVVSSFGGIKAQAQMFGSSHTIDNTSYSYDSSSDDGTYQTDTYYGGGAALHLRGRMGATVTLAEVSGAYSGFFDGNFRQLTEDSPPESYSFTSPNNRVYDYLFTRTTYTVNLASDVVNASSQTCYFGQEGLFLLPPGGVNGPITGSESGWLHNGILLLNSSSTGSWIIGEGNSMSLFGSTYHVTYSASTTTYNSAGQGSSWSTSSYASFEGGSWSQTTTSLPDQPSSDSSGGNDPYVGNWGLVSGSVSSNPQFAPRQSAKFAPSVFRVNGVVLSLAQSVINDAAGNITDSYSGNGITVTVTGNARDYEANSGAASMTVTVGGTAYTGSLTLGGGLSGFDPTVCDVRFSEPNTGTPCFSVPVLYVEGVPYGFAGGYDENSGNRTDIYQHDGVLLRLAGNVADPSTASVAIGTHQGTLAGGVFTVLGCVIKTQALLEGPPAFWVHGILYIKEPGTTTYASEAATPQTITLSGDQSDALALSGTISTVALTGTYNAQLGGVFNVTLGGVSRLACPAEASGALRQGPALEDLSGAEGPHPAFAGLPAAVRISVTVPVGTEPLRLDVALNFLGLAIDDDSTGHLVACYGNAFASTPPEATSPFWKQNLHLLKIRAATGTSKTVTLRDYKAVKTTDGFYDTSSRLFQATLKPSNALIKALPIPVMSLEPGNNYAFWFIDGPAGGLPRSFIIRGQPWWYAGEVGGKQVYRGFYTEQEMTLPVTADANGQRLVKLKDYAFDINGNLTPGTTNETQGTLSGVRSSIRFRDNTLALSGTESGTQQAVTVVDDFTLHTIRSDVDIVGNNLSFGILKNDASLAGALFRFEDSGITTRLSSILSRPSAEWVWWKQHESDLQALRAVMFLDQDHRLQLYPATPSIHPGVILNPDGASSFKGPVRVAPGGDIPMGGFAEGPVP